MKTAFQPSHISPSLLLYLSHPPFGLTLCYLHWYSGHQFHACTSDHFSLPCFPLSPISCIHLCNLFRFYLLLNSLFIRNFFQHPSISSSLSITFRPSPYYSIFRSPSLSRPTLSLLPSLSVPPSLSFFLSFSPYTSLPLSLSLSLSPSLPLWSGEWGERPCSIQSAWELSQWRGHEDKLHRLPRSCHVQVRTTILASQSLCILSIVKWRFCIAFSPPSLILVPFLLFFPLLPSSPILLSCLALTFLLHLSAPLRTFFQYSSIFFSSLLPAILLSSLNYSPLISLLFSSLPSTILLSSLNYSPLISLLFSSLVWLFLSSLTSSLHFIGGLLLTRNVSSSPSRH